MAGRTIKRTIAANQSTEVSVEGQYVFMKSTTALVTAEVNGRRVELESGDSIETAPFKGFHVFNDNASAVTLVMVVGTGAFKRTAVTGAVDVNRPSNFDGVADKALNNGSETVVLAADSTRASVTLSSITANTVEIRVGGDGSVGAAQGTPLQPGESITISWDMGAAGGISAYCAAASQYLAISVSTD